MSVQQASQKENAPIGQQSPILHCTHREVRNSHQVQLWQRVARPKHLREEWQGTSRHSQGMRTQMRAVGGRVDSDSHTVHVLRLDVIKLPNYEGHDVRGHERRLIKGNSYVGMRGDRR